MGVRESECESESECVWERLCVRECECVWDRGRSQLAVPVLCRLVRHLVQEVRVQGSGVRVSGQRLRL